MIKCFRSILLKYYQSDISARCINFCATAHVYLNVPTAAKYPLPQKVADFAKI